MQLDFIGIYRMKNIKGGITKLMAAALVASSFAPSLANAADIIEDYDQCSCRTQPAASGSIGVIKSFGGYVEFSGANGTAAATQGAQLSVGSQVVTAAGANASVSVGQSCHYDLDGNTILSVGKSSTSAELCVVVSQTQVAPAPVATTAAAGGNSGLGLLLIAAAAGAAAFALDGGSSKSVSN